MIYPHHGQWPQVHPSVFIAPSVDLIGELSIGEQSSVWFQCVIRADVNWIKIGARTNIQDHSMLHVNRRDCPLSIGDDVTVGHRAMIHGCQIGDRCLIGMGAIIMDKAVIGDDCVIAAGAVVTEHKVIPARSLVMGMPAKVIRELTSEELAYLKKSADNYVQDSKEYLDEFAKLNVLGPKRIDQ
jgi:carbonic anhydrase/acetyltransferase-like protein (isoleucine patch superfamily)